LHRNQKRFQDFNKSKEFLGGKNLAFLDSFGVRKLGFKVSELLEFKDSIRSCDQSRESVKTSFNGGSDGFRVSGLEVRKRMEKCLPSNP